MWMLQCVAVCCSVLQCVAVCGSVSKDIRIPEISRYFGNRISKESWCADVFESGCQLHPHTRSTGICW